MQNWFIEDNVEMNSLWAFDYCFCCGKCENKECGRNNKSKSYKEMMRTVTYHSALDLTKFCYGWRKPTEKIPNQGKHITTPVIEPAKCNCAICGTENNFYVYVTNHPHSGTFNLDLRMRGNEDVPMRDWVQECKKCGYVARNLSYDGGKVTRKWMGSKAYKQSDGIEFRSELADRFYKFYKISLLNGKTEAAFYALQYASWVCDDSKDTENAVRCRKMAIPLLNKLIEELDTGKADSQEDCLGVVDQRANKYKLMKADLLRRSGQFETLLSEYASCSFKSEIMNKVLAFQLRKAAEKDTDCYTVEEAVNGNSTTVGDMSAGNGMKFVKLTCPGD